MAREMTPQETNNVVEMVSDLRDPWLEIDYHYRERISEALIELNNRASESQSLSDRIDVLEGENAKLREALWNARQQAKRRGKDILQDEANAVLPHFRRKWEPLRTVAKRTGQYSAQQLASRARDLCKRGLVEQRWNDGVMRISEWRSTGGRRVPITISGQMPLASLTQGGKNVAG